MSRLTDLIEELDDMAGCPFTPDQVVAAFNGKIAEMGLEGVTCDYADPAVDGSVLVGFSDSDSSIDILFTGQEAMVVDPSGDDNHDITIDLTPLDPPSVAGDTSDFVDLSDLSWMNLTTLKTIFTAGSISEGFKFEEDMVPVEENYEKVEGEEDCFEAVRIKVDSTGKIKRIPIVRRKKKILTAAQKAGIRRAALKRAKDPDMKRKRAKAMLIRARLHLAPVKKP